MWFNRQVMGWGFKSNRIIRECGPCSTGRKPDLQEMFRTMERSPRLCKTNRKWLERPRRKEWLMALPTVTWRCLGPTGPMKAWPSSPRVCLGGAESLKRHSNQLMEGPLGGVWGRKHKFSGEGLCLGSFLAKIMLSKKTMMLMIMVIRIRFKTTQDGFLARSQEDEKERVILDDFKVTEWRRRKST